MCACVNLRYLAKIEKGTDIVCVCVWCVCVRACLCVFAHTNAFLCESVCCASHSLHTQIQCIAFVLMYLFSSYTRHGHLHFFF